MGFLFGKFHVAASESRGARAQGEKDDRRTGNWIERIFWKLDCCYPPGEGGAMVFIGGQGLGMREFAESWRTVLRF